MSILSSDSKHVWHPFTQHQTENVPLEIIRAKNTKLFAADGKEYIDANSSWWVNVHGHGHPHIGEALKDQFERIDHVIFAGVTHPKAVELAERVCSKLPDSFQKVFFSDNGSTSVEVALKMVFQYFHNKGNPKTRILAMDGAYHGDTFGAMSVGQRDFFNRPFEYFFFDVDFLDFPIIQKQEQLLKKAEELFKTDEFAGLIVEPLVQGSAGMRMYPAEFLDKLCSIARKYEVKVIFDEVMTAWGRTGRLFAMDFCSIKPDIVCLSKGLTGGVLPLGLTVTSNQIFDNFLSEEKARGLLHGHSFTGNPLACAAACASLDIFERKETDEKIKLLSSHNSIFMDEIKGHPAVKEIRQCGTILAIELKINGLSNYFDSSREEAYNYFLKNEILLRPLGNVIFINPPYCITDSEYEKLKKVIKGFMDIYMSR